MTTSYDMVLKGFEGDGVLRMILDRLELMEKQGDDLIQAAVVADETTILLANISETAEQLIDAGQEVVNSTIERNIIMLISATFGLVVIVISLFFGLRRWINRSLKSITSQLSKLTQHDLRGLALVDGPTEIRDIASKLNQVVDSTTPLSKR
ncbi:methyl-accepting chemotaxis protein [Vibrio astriarenae]|nr:methyl-accepting chemotaxis protein [Vibrio sp. C7]